MELKDAKVPSLFETSVNLLKTFLVEVMPQLFLRVTEFRGENISHNSKTSLDKMT